jgi:hypothetical protein
MLGQRRRVTAASALSAAAGGSVWVVLVTAGLSAGVATAAACVVAFGLASVAAWRVNKRLFGLLWRMRSRSSCWSRPSG